MTTRSINQKPITEADKAEAYEILSDYALRFDAPRYEQEHDLKVKIQDSFHKLREGKTVHLDHLEQMCLFVGLQRYLSKWGGEMLSLSSIEHRLYRELFLSFAKVEIPQEYSSDNERSDLKHNGWYSIWERKRSRTCDDDMLLVRRVHESLLI